MRASISIPALLLLASVAVAQDDTTTASVATSTDDGVLTIQTQTSVSSDPWACYEQQCFMEPCPPSPCSSTESSIVGTPIPMPRPRPESVSSVITDASLSSVTGFMSIPAGETPISSGAVETPTVTSSSAVASTRGPTSSGSPQTTPNAAVLNARANHIPLAAAVAGAFALL